MTYHPELRNYRPRARVTYGMKQAVAARDGLVAPGLAPTRCAYCSRSLTWEWIDKKIRLIGEDGHRVGEIDHIEPLSCGGMHEVANLVPACAECNRFKRGSQLPEALRQRVASGEALTDLLSEVLAAGPKQLASDLLSGSLGDLPRSDFYPVPSRPVPTTIPPVPSRSTSADQDRFNTVDLIGSERASASNSAISVGSLA